MGLRNRPSGPKRKKPQVPPLRFAPGGDDNSVGPQEVQREILDLAIKLSSRPERSVVEGPAVSSTVLMPVGCEQAVLPDINPIGPLPRFCGRKPAIVVLEIMGGEFLLKERPRRELSVAKAIRV
jgi:hypothetical protein